MERKGKQNEGKGREMGVGAGEMKREEEGRGWRRWRGRETVRRGDKEGGRRERTMREREGGVREEEGDVQEGERGNSEGGGRGL